MDIQGWRSSAALQRQQIGAGAKARNAALGRHADIAVTTKFLPRGGIGQVHLDHWHADRSDRVIEAERRVGEGSRVQQHCLRALGIGLVQPVDQMALMVRLTKIDRDPRAQRRILDPSGNIVERFIAVNVRLSRSQQG